MPETLIEPGILKKIDAIGDCIWHFLESLQKGEDFKFDLDTAICNTITDSYEVMVESSIWSNQRTCTWEELKNFLNSYGIQLIDGILNTNESHQRSNSREEMAVIDAAQLDSLDIESFKSALESRREAFVKATETDVACQVVEVLEEAGTLEGLPPSQIMAVLRRAYELMELPKPPPTR